MIKSPITNHKLPMLLLLVAVVITACHHYEFEYGVDFSTLPNHGLYFMPYSEHLHDFSQENNQSPIRKASSIDGIGLLRGLTEGLTSYSVKQVSGTYISVNSAGDSIRLSGAVYYPTKGDIKGIIVSCHYTVCADYEVPSMSCFMDAWLATKGYAVVMPDYMGYGYTVDSVHPYMQADLTARHVIDMALAVRPFFQDRKLTIQSSDIILMGYSQGAHAAMHALRLIEDNAKYPEYADTKLTVKRCCVGGGPYYMSEFYRRCAGNNYIGIPCAVPMMVLGINVGRKQQGKAEFDLNYFFSQRTLANYKDWVLSKRYTVDQMNELIGTNNLDEILTPEACDLNGQPQSYAFWMALKEHDVPSDFKPKAKLLVFHSTKDNVVPFYNASWLRDQMQMLGKINVEYDFDDYGVHGMAFARFLLKMYKSL